MDVFEKCSKVYNQVQEMSRSGFYFYFRKLESPQDSEVVVNGKRVIMIGSNNYLGLTSHPRVKEAAIKAIENTAVAVRVHGSERKLEIHEDLRESWRNFSGRTRPSLATVIKPTRRF
jgi:7-keto-8-aminopelargonate synthetase-like enzyme